MMRYGKILRGKSFWERRRPAWDSTLMAMYRVSDEVAGMNVGDYSSLFVTAGNAERVVQDSGSSKNWYHLFQRLGLPVEDGNPHRIPLNEDGTIELLTRMMSVGNKEIDGVITTDDEGRLCLGKGMRCLNLDVHAIIAAKGGLEDGAGGNVLAYTSLILPGVAGYKVGKSGGTLFEYVGGWKDVEYYPRTGKIAVFTVVRGGSGDDGKPRRMQFLEANRDEGMVTPFDVDGNRRKRRSMNEMEAKLFCPR
jgi:hypothetical protein